MTTRRRSEEHGRMTIHIKLVDPQIEKVRGLTIGRPWKAAGTFESSIKRVD